MPLKFLFVVFTLIAVVSQLLLRRATNSFGRAPAALADLPRFIVRAAHSPWIYAALALQIFGYVLWLLIVSREKLGVATATIGAGFYLLMALSAWMVYGEALTWVQWVGIVLVTLGVVCVSQGVTP